MTLRLDIKPLREGRLKRDEIGTTLVCSCDVTFWNYAMEEQKGPYVAGEDGASGGCCCCTCSIGCECCFCCVGVVVVFRGIKLRANNSHFSAMASAPISTAIP